MNNSSAQFQELVSKIMQAAQSEDPICLVGEVGSGKRQAANSVHKASMKRNGRFVLLNCVGLDQKDFAADLMGKMSPDGEMTRKGAASLADNGTLYIHEVSELSKDSQAILVRFLETETFRPVGTQMSFQTNCRVVVSTSGSLETMVEMGSFRSDLYHLLTSIVIHLPRLNDRIADIPILFRSVLQELGSRHDRMINEDAIDRLQNHNFTGNLIELRNIASRVLSQNKDQVITRADIDRALRGTEYYDISHDQDRVGLIGSLSEEFAASLPSPEKTQAVLANEAGGSTDQTDEAFANLNTVAKIKDMPATDEDALMDNTSKSSSESSEKVSSEDTSGKDQESDGVLNFREQEIKYFRDLLERFQGDKQKVADASGLNLRTLYRRLNNLDIDWP
jgi:DNA-binding NtrC family response regulator